MKLEDEPHTLYFFWHGRRLLYVGITNDRRRRISEHRGLKPWYTESTKITMKWYPNRRAVLDAEERLIKRKRPLYNIQHNAAVESVQLSPEDFQRAMAAKVAMACAGVLAIRYVADVSSAWWLRRRMVADSIDLSIPAPRNPFKEDPPPAALQLLNAFCGLAAQSQLRPAQAPEAL